MQYQGVTLHERDGKFYFEDLELAEAHEGKGKDNRKRSSFLKKYNLSRSAASSISISHLLKGRSGRRRAFGSHHLSKTLAEEVGENPEVLGWFQHNEMFFHSQSQSYVLTTQPRNLDLEKFQALEQFCQEKGLTCFINYEEAWWDPGKAPLIVICKTDMSKIFE